uniref:Resistance protein PSH-RGH6 n=1 Tax=Solanum tuberosum TaxID=4113 RepID=M1C8Z2_SOLTU
MNKWKEMQNKYNNIKDLKVQSMSLGDVSRLAVETENVMVGHENEFEMMQDQIARGSNELEVVSIVGMGGIGKTTLANKVYSDPFIMSRFDIRAKITVSQEYCARNVLLGLLSSVSGKADELYEQQDDGQLADRLQKLLKGRRYLIVIDDIWTTDSWDDVKLCFPDCDRGSRILMTTRNMEVAEYASSGKPPCQMSLMNFDESWSLLFEKVFVKDNFSPEFEQLGKQIALECKGLPLTIVVIAGLLSKVGKTLNEWTSVAKNVSSKASIDLDIQCMRVLSLSYHHLPRHLKSCFLYFAIFPEDKLFFVNELMELWTVEGFLKVEKTKTIEEVAETCLKDLIDRSLIFIHHFTFDGKIKSCGMHDVTRELCLREA